MNKTLVIATLLVLVIIAGCASQQATTMKSASTQSTESSTDSEASGFAQDISDVDTLDKDTDTTEIDSMDKDFASI